MFFSDSESETFTLGISMFYAGASVEEAFSVQSLVSTPPLQNLIQLQQLFRFERFRIRAKNGSDSETLIKRAQLFWFTHELNHRQLDHRYTLQLNHPYTHQSNHLSHHTMVNSVECAAKHCIEVVIDVLVRGGLCELHSLGWATASGVTPVSRQSST
jgi:hypothetical protein